MNKNDSVTIDGPHFVSHGLFTVTGNITIDAYTPLKPATSLSSGTFGVSGVYYVRAQAAPYNDISGISGCCGITLRKVWADTETGLKADLFTRKNLAVLHMGYIRLPYLSGTLDGTVRTLQFGDLVAPCTSGFRVFQELNYGTATGEGSNTRNVMHTGTRQSTLGIYSDFPSNMTGTTGMARRRILVLPSTIFGVRP